MNEKKVIELLKTMEKAKPPVGMRERVLSRLNIMPVELNRFQRLLFTNPLRAACIVSMASTVLLWVVFGENFSDILASLLG